VTEPTSPIAVPVPASEAPLTVFVWHPVYKGCDVASVRRETIDEIRRDQRAYLLALDGAERDEQSSLQSIMKLDDRWVAYDFGWTEADPAQLADRVIAVALEREKRQEMTPVRELRDSFTPVETAKGVRVDEDSIAHGLSIPRWAYLLITALVIAGLILGLVVSIF
jgi:hypothetical protein